MSPQSPAYPSRSPGRRRSTAGRLSALGARGCDGPTTMHGILRERARGRGSPLRFRQRAGLKLASKRLVLETTLQGHAGCVNTVTWNAAGTKLVSGSDDMRVCIWDYAARSDVGSRHVHRRVPPCQPLASLLPLSSRRAAPPPRAHPPPSPAPCLSQADAAVRLGPLGEHLLHVIPPSHRRPRRGVLRGRRARKSEGVRRARRVGLRRGGALP